MSRKSQVAGLLQRYQFIDFAAIVDTPPAHRKERLVAYLDRNRRGRWRSYKGFRSLVPDIAGVQRGLDPTDTMSKDEIHRGLRLRCHPDDVSFNTEAADVFFDYVRPKGLDSYSDHPRSSLRVGPDRTISMGVEHYVISDDRGFFRWVYPRRERLLGNIPTIAMSLIHHNYVRGDFSEFEVQMVDLSCEPEIGPRGGLQLHNTRKPRTLTLSTDELMHRDELSEQANHVYTLLMEIADEG